MIRTFAAALALSCIATGTATARDYCSTRPSLGQSACVLDAGRFAIETALVDWEAEIGDDERTDTVLLADTLLRAGLTDRIELQVQWTPAGVVRERDQMAIARSTRVGDLAIGMRANLIKPDGSGFSLALQPSVALPVGRRPVGDGDWSAMLIVPAGFDLSDILRLQLSPTIAAAVDEDGDGRHLAYGGVVGVEAKLSDAVSIALEGQAMRDVGEGTALSGGLSLGWMASDDLQFDVGGVVGLDRDTPDMRLYAGISHRF